MQQIWIWLINNIFWWCGGLDMDVGTQIKMHKIFTPLPPSCKPMNCNWIFKVKYNVDGFVAKHKAHLVARGFTQVEGIDFNETFSLVVWMESIQTMLVVVTIENFKVQCQMNVKKKFFECRYFKRDIDTTTKGVCGQKSYCFVNLIET